MQDFQRQVTEILVGVRDATVAYVPRVVAGLALLLLAVVVASVAERIARAVLVRLRFDALVRRSGGESWTKRLGMRSPLSDLIPRVLFWVLMFLFVAEAAETMGLDGVSESIGRLIGYLPNVLAAFFILLLGGAVARSAGRGVEQLGVGTGLEFARPLGRFTTGMLLFVVVVMALAQLEVETLLVRHLSLVVLGSAALALALSLGLGTRDVTRSVIAGFYARKVFEVGEEFEVQGHRGTLEAITATQTLIRTDGRVVVLPNSVFLDSPASGPM